jgi:hypothetical protein
VEPSGPDEARDDRADRAAQNEAVFRRVNERLEEVNEAFQAVTDNAEFVCECATIECAERVQMTLSKYEALRRDPTHFIVKPDHVLPEEERVVERQEQYVVVEKYGRAGQRARQLDPRSD